MVGAGPNGLAAAITLAQAGKRVRVIEGHETVGGGARTAELTLPGFRHDICSAIHPLGVGSPFFEKLPLAEYGLEWIYPRYALAHPLDDGTAVVLEREVAASAATMGRDAAAYTRLMTPLVKGAAKLFRDLLGPFPVPPRYPLNTIPFGMLALLPASVLVKLFFREQRARAIVGGMAAHSILPLDMPVTASFGLMLGMVAHAIGWPMARGGSQSIVDAMTAYLQSLGGEVVTGQMVTHLSELPAAQATLFDVAPRGLVKIAGGALPEGYKRALGKFRYGPGVFKVDYALDGPVPWTAGACHHAGTVHVGGTFEEIRKSEQQVADGEHPYRPFVLVAQQSLFDPTRAPRGKHTLWAYCHVPHGSDRDMSAAIEEQIERFAPGFRNRILAKRTATAQQVESYNPNYVGGDINAGAQTLFQFFTRPTWRWNPYTTPNRKIYLCSSSTPPGGGVHGMCGYHAARTALRRMKD